MVSTFYAMYGIACTSGAMFILDSRKENPSCVFDPDPADGCFTGAAIPSTQHSPNTHPRPQPSLTCGACTLRVCACTHGVSTGTHGVSAGTRGVSAGHSGTWGGTPGAAMHSHQVLNYQR